jgi:hypothetical protein
MSRAVAVTVVAAVVLASLAAGAAVGQSGDRTLQTPDGFDSTTYRVTVYENGSATWTIEHRQPLDTESEVDEFEAYADEFESQETELYLDFVDDAEALTQFGASETDREMTAEGFRRSAAVDPAQNQGTVRMSFRWTDFARTEGDRVIVSDVFEGGFYVGNSQRMVFERGPGLAFASAQPAPDSRSAPDSLADSESVSWVGERSFNDSRPYVELGPRQAVQAAAGTPQPPAVDQGDGPGMLPYLALVVIVLGVVGAVAWRSGAVAAVTGTGDNGATATGSAPEPSPTPSPDPVGEEELLSDSDRVRKLLEDNGGRMKQVDIVETTDWSKSKVSMLLSEMEDEGEISKLRVGRENIISLAGEEPDAAGSPFDEE